MARRKMLVHPNYVREKIRASQLLNRLQKCAFGEISLTITNCVPLKSSCATPFPTLRRPNSGQSRPIAMWSNSRQF
jgi:hypothetical protein